jgi:hypothetical protein
MLDAKLHAGIMNGLRRPELRLIQLAEDRLQALARIQLRLHRRDALAVGDEHARRSIYSRLNSLVFGVW